MRRLRVVCTGLLSAFFLSGCARNEKPLTPSQALFVRNCAVCHGQVGEGKQVGTQIIPSLNAERARGLSNEQLTHQIFNGGKGMPPFRYSLTDEQIQDLVRFIREEIQKTGEAGDVQQKAD